MTAPLTFRRDVKEESGKVFTVELSVDSECRVLKLGISGDFFAYPPELIDRIERDAAGRPVSELVDLVSRGLRDLVLVGVSKEALVPLFRSLVEEATTRCRETRS